MCVGLIAEAAAGRLMDEQGGVGGGDDHTAAACFPSTPPPSSKPSSRTNEIPHMILHHLSALTTPELLNAPETFSLASPQTLVEHLFFHTGNGTRAQINLKISTNFSDGSVAERANNADSKCILKKKKNKKKLTGCCLIPPRCSPKTIGVKAWRRELSAAAEHKRSYLSKDVACSGLSQDPHAHV